MIRWPVVSAISYYRVHAEEECTVDARGEDAMTFNVATTGVLLGAHLSF